MFNSVVSLELAKLAHDAAYEVGQQWRASRVDARVNAQYQQMDAELRLRQEVLACQPGLKRQAMRLLRVVPAVDHEDARVLCFEIMGLVDQQGELATLDDLRDWAETGAQCFPLLVRILERTPDDGSGVPAAAAA